MSDGVTDPVNKHAPGLSSYWIPLLLAVVLAIALGLAAMWSFPTDEESIEESDRDDDDSSTKEFDESLPDIHPYLSGSVSNIFIEDDGIESQRDEQKQRRFPTWYSDGESRAASAAVETWSIADGLGLFHTQDDTSYTDSQSNPLKDILSVHKK
jgi:hypothetical protein